MIIKPSKQRIANVRRGVLLSIYSKVDAVCNQVVVDTTGKTYAHLPADQVALANAIQTLIGAAGTLEDIISTAEMEDAINDHVDNP